MLRHFSLNIQQIFTVHLPLSGFVVALETYQREKQVKISACLQSGRKQTRNTQGRQLFPQVRRSEVLWRKRKQEGKREMGTQGEGKLYFYLEYFG